MSMLKMDPKVFREYQALVHEKIGIALHDGKESLVSARVAKRMRELGLNTHQEYLGVLRRDEDGQEMTHFMDAISTNVTSFFREGYHFEFIAEQMRAWLRNGQTRFRFWSAACSTGEEPYSLGMTLLDATATTPTDTRILATDISQRVLRRSSAGLYSDDNMKNVPEAFRKRYFLREGNEWRVRPELRSLISFNSLNLLHQPFPMKGPFDAIFCRNVMIYFDRELRGRLITEFHRLLRPGGYLFVGHAESLLGSDKHFRLVKPTIYTKR